MSELAIIGGSGLTSLDNLEITRKEMVSTPYGEPSAAMTHGVLADTEVVFLPRHGYAHTIPPHKINYRANIWALRQIGVAKVIAVAAVGGIRADMAPGVLVVPDEIIDYTWGRGHTFFEVDLAQVTHIDFTYPYSVELRQRLIDAARAAKIGIRDNGTYGATQGPRLETAAEIRRMERDGCDMVGMTGMPEAALAREFQIEYATCAVVANWAAGKTGGELSQSEIERNLEHSMAHVKSLLLQAIPSV